MKISELNNLLRSMVIRLSNNGWVKTNIGKVLLGTSGQSQISNWLKKENDNSEKSSDFGFKPLQRVGSLLNYSPHIVFIKDDDEDEFIKLVYKKNKDFVNELELKISEYLSKGIVDDRMTKPSKDKVSKFVDDLLEDDLSMFNNDNQKEI